MLKKACPIFPVFLILLFFIGISVNSPVYDRAFSVEKLTLEQEKEAGRYVLDLAIRESGLYEDKEMKIFFQNITDKIAKNSGERPELKFQVVLLNDPSVNAHAYPGGYLAVNKGLIDLLKEKYGNDKKSMEEMTSAVLSHEIAHVQRRHTDHIAYLYFDKKTELIKMAEKAENNASMKMTFLKYKRDMEDEADKYGLLYLLRAGYGTKPMENLMEFFIEMEKDEPLLFASYEGTHSTPSDRLAHIKEIQAEVFRMQSKYNDAELILKLGLQGDKLDLAIDNLNQVLAYFPHSPAIHHALGVAYYRRYLSRISPEKQELKPSFAFYSFNALRGGADDYDLKKAQKEFEYVMNTYGQVQFQGIENTVSAYGLVLIDLGEKAEGLKWCQKAVEVSPKNRHNLNNLGIAYHKNHKSDEAIKYYLQAMDTVKSTDLAYIMDKAKESPDVAKLGRIEISAPLFNLAYAYQLKGDQQKAFDYYNMYLSLDHDSPWSQVAQKRLASLSQGTTASESVKSQIFAGVQDFYVGDAFAGVTARLGSPDKSRVLDSGIQVREYDGQGITFYVEPQSGNITSILVMSPFSSTVNGFKLNESLNNIQTKLGSPATTEKQDRLDIWDYSPYGAYMMFSENKLVGILIIGTHQTKQERTKVASQQKKSSSSSNSTGVQLGYTPEQVKSKLGEPPEKDHSEEGNLLWGYTPEWTIFQFDSSDKVNLILFNRSSDQNIGGIRIGDDQNKITAVYGAGQNIENDDGTVTITYTSLNIGFLIDKSTGKVKEMAVVKMK